MESFMLFICKYVFGFFLQEIMFVLGIYTFSKQNVEKKTFFLMLSFLVPTSIIVRNLPISYGIHILINVAVILYTTYQFCQFELYVIIRSTLLTIMLVLLNEMLCFGTLLLAFGAENADSILKNDLLKAEVIVPFNLVFTFIIYMCYRRMLRKNY